ncbi:metallophosphoesterase family protein [Paenibacillus sp. GCM10027627]|uniref:metallophosphoesterase family protein n=1 Tax=unclassified Paenibacillus TaxID=185978 RepID=UPI003637818E
MIKIRTLAISDIHGCLNQFEELLKISKYNSNSDQLILLGDYIDRGNKSKAVLDKVIHLNKEYGVIVLKGNHDQMMIDAFENDEDGLWLNNGGITTVQSYVGFDFFNEGFNWDEYLKAKQHIVEFYLDHIKFLKELPLYFEDDKHIFVHAGINPYYSNWREQPESEFYWVREDFYKNATKLSKKVVFGHTPTEYLHGISDIWFGGDKIGIDGACAYGRQLNCLEIKDDGYRQYNIKK